MSARSPGAFYVNVDDDGALVLRGQLDIGTIQDLQDKIDDVMVPGWRSFSTWRSSPSWTAARSTASSRPVRSRVIESSFGMQHLLFAASSSWPTPRQSPKHGCSTGPDSVGLPIAVAWPLTVSRRALLVTRPRIAAASILPCAPPCTRRAGRAPPRRTPASPA